MKSLGRALLFGSIALTGVVPPVGASAQEEGSDDPLPFLIALDPETGEERWRREGSEIGVRRVIGEANGLVFVYETPCMRGGHNLDASLLAFDVDSGKRQWRVPARLPRPGETEWSVGGDTVVVEDGELYGLDPETGDERWSRPGSLRPVAGTDELVLLVDDQRDIANPSSLDEPGVVYAIDRSTGKRLWSYSSSDYLPLIQMDVVVVRPDTAIVDFSGFGPQGPVGGQASIDLKTGKELWNVPTNRANLDAEPGGPLLSGIVDGGQFIPLTVFDPRTRAARWAVPAPFPVPGVLAQTRRIVVTVVSDVEGLREVALDARSGSVEWEREAGGTILAMGRGLIVEEASIDADDQVVAVDVRTGEPRWTQPNPIGGLRRWLIGRNVYVSGGCLGAEPG